MAGRGQPPYTDGEKIPDDRIRDIFCPPPLIPTGFSRSALIVGSKGSGKTTLFRYQKEIHQETHGGIGLHISLGTEFANLTRQTALGPLATDYPADVERLLAGKATSLLGISIAERLIKKGLSLPLDPLKECIPCEILPEGSTVDLEWCSSARRRLPRSLESFDEISESSPLRRLVSAFGEICQKQRGPLLLLLDRADMVPAPALVPVVELLDQSSGYVALVATRPGHGGAAITRLVGHIVPGDHYDVFHLGTLPRSKEWVNFVKSVVVTQLGEKAVSSVASDTRAGMIAASRDSLRTALELFARTADGPPDGAQDRLLSALEGLSDTYVSSVQTTLRPYHPDFRALLNALRQILLKDGPIRGPVTLSIEERLPHSLFDKATVLPHFVEASLRCGALCMPEGRRWIPGLHPTNLEVPYLLIWRKSDPLWSGEGAPVHHISYPENAVLEPARGGARDAPAVFVAYRMNFEQSKRFRQRLEEAIRANPSLARWTVLDGHVPGGARWADVIRERIKRSRAVIGDVTGMRNDVVFELGFAFGLGRRVIPVVSDPQQRSGLPFWLGATQFDYYNDWAGLTRIVSSIEAHFFDSEFRKVARPPSPVPGLAVWMRVLDWNQTAKEQFVRAAETDGLRVEVLDDETPGDQVIRRGASAALLAVSLDGTARDALMHYICGAVISHPRAGYGSKGLQRRILVMEPPGGRQGAFAAESLSRCADIVRVIKLGSVATETEQFGRAYRTWLEAGPKSGRR